MMPEAVMKPAITGCERKLARKPSRKQAQQIRNAARQEGQRQRGGVVRASLLGHDPTAAAVISETTATGPTASARLVPKIA
jgi:hypothetical protein